MSKNNPKYKLPIYIIAGLAIVLAAFTFIRSRNDIVLRVPEPEDLDRVIMVDVIEEEAVGKITIDQEADIEKILEIFSNSKNTDGESISKFPHKGKFTAVLFSFKSGGNSLRSIYEEDGEIYIDQPFYGIFTLYSNDLEALDQIIKRGNKEDISLPVEDILKDDF